MLLMSSVYRRRRIFTAVVLAFAVFLLGLYLQTQEERELKTNTTVVSSKTQQAVKALDQLEVKGRAPKTGYSRDMFGKGWQKSGDCNTRDDILARDLKNTEVKDCKVYSGVLNDPYTGKVIYFSRGPTSSSKVQIDHVVALSDAWQKGAQQLDESSRQTLANDPLELLAVDGPANQNKGDGDAATWLPSNKAYRCRYVARQIAVKLKYSLWVTQAERDAMQRVLSVCPSQQLPEVGS